MDNSIYNRWMKNENFRDSFLHKLDDFLKSNNLNIEKCETTYNTVRIAFEGWLNNSHKTEFMGSQSKCADDFNTPWDAFSYFCEKNKDNSTYFSKGYNRLWLMKFK